MVDGRGSDTCDVRCVHCICVMVFNVSGGEGVERYMYECMHVWGGGGGGGEETWLHGHVRCVPVCVMMFEGEGGMCTYIRMYLCGGGEEGVIPVNVRCEFVIVLVGGGMDGYIWGVYGSMYISCKCEEAEYVKV